jgi:hypothetical protein
MFENICVGSFRNGKGVDAPKASDGRANPVPACRNAGALPSMDVRWDYRKVVAWNGTTDTSFRKPRLSATTPHRIPNFQFGDQPLTIPISAHLSGLGVTRQLTQRSTSE